MSPSASTFQTWRRRCLSVVFYVFFYLCGFGKRVQPDQVDLQRALLLHGQGEGQVAEGVEGHRDFGADGADQRRLEEAVEDVHDDGVVPLDVALPRLLRHQLAARRKTGCITLRLHANFTKKKSATIASKFLNKNKSDPRPHLVWPAIGVLQLDVRLLPDAIQVLVEAVEEEGQEFVRVLLLVARELGGKAAHLGLVR